MFEDSSMVKMRHRTLILVARVQACVTMHIQCIKYAMRLVTIVCYALTVLLVGDLNFY